MTAEIYDEIVIPVVELLGGGAAAAELVYRTGLAESGYRTRRQYGGGPALGFWQMEPATHDDIWENFLGHRDSLAELVMYTAGVSQAVPPPTADVLETNDRYAAAMCRVHYLRVPGALPDAGDLDGQARYWKAYYNTELGAGTIEHFMGAAVKGV